MPNHLLPASLLLEVELVDQSDDLCEHFSRWTFGLIETSESNACVNCIWRPHDYLDALIDNIN